MFVLRSNFFWLTNQHDAIVLATMFAKKPFGVALREFDVFV
jgi:hypothetical protein